MLPSRHTISLRNVRPLLTACRMRLSHYLSYVITALRQANATKAMAGYQLGGLIGPSYHPSNHAQQATAEPPGTNCVCPMFGLLLLDPGTIQRIDDCYAEFDVRDRLLPGNQFSILHYRAAAVGT